ncbi:membrane protein insertase YidC [Paraflavitalea sp. CAU 1676]|uniref:membrane protein insertase YidC n=1 Tax=Paraflavitalea sp. CAU 1676 TaxID=3032598 RepID=UPI0023DB23FB|nr:membrane protein insertase YidC [Paraflavitalea sp. CAU 1676]MDF2191711.1 membrane protein insertase YidC [Paraflavitalea sp. CAU 1676]
MNMDRNTIIGFVLLAGLLFVYLFISTKNTHELQGQRQHYEDSVARVKRALDSTAAIAKRDTAIKAVLGTDSLLQQVQGVEKLVTVENEVIKVTFTNKGGQPGKVELKNYKSADSNLVVLNGTSFDKISYPVNAAPNQVTQVSDLYFISGDVVKNADNSQSIVFRFPSTNGTLTHTFTIRPNDYLIDFNVQLAGADKLLTQGAFNLTWQNQPVSHESDFKYERSQSTICYYTDNDFDYVMTKSDRKFETPTQWVAVSQQFFNTALIAKTGFNSFSTGETRWTRHTDSSNKIADVTTTLQAKLPLGADALVPLQLYYGPNDYKILKKQPVAEMDKIINLGRDMYAFVRPINKYIVMPVFNFFNSFIGSMGIAILLLTLFIRLATSPLMYPGYLTSAKMKILRPDLAKLKEKYPDQQQFAMEQMKFMREAGVNQFAGCLPSLLQIPIFFALYSFFNSNIALRGEEFLWAKNLASYDVLVHFSFEIPGLGNHLSLFTITACLTSFLISFYNMASTPDQGNPALKYMPYIFPFILLFVFNKLPAALTWYYTVSNIITLLLQFVIQHYVINHDKLVAKIEDARKKPKAKSKWAERLELMQEQQKKMQEERTKGKK